MLIYDTTMNDRRGARLKVAIQAYSMALRCSVVTLILAMAPGPALA
jgi:hypothetical protein